MHYKIIEHEGFRVKVQKLYKIYDDVENNIYHICEGGILEGFPDWQTVADMENGDVSSITRDGWTRYDFTYLNSNTHAYYGYVNLEKMQVLVNVGYHPADVEEE